MRCPAICSHLFHLAFNDHYKIIIVIIIKRTKKTKKRITLCLLLCLQLSVFSSKAISKTFWRVLDEKILIIVTTRNLEFAAQNGLLRHSHVIVVGVGTVEVSRVSPYFF